MLANAEELGVVRYDVTLLYKVVIIVVSKINRTRPRLQPGSFRARGKNLAEENRTPGFYSRIYGKPRKNTSKRYSVGLAYPAARGIGAIGQL